MRKLRCTYLCILFIYYNIKLLIEILFVQKTCISVTRVHCARTVRERKYPKQTLPRTMTEQYRIQSQMDACQDGLLSP